MIFKIDVGHHAKNAAYVFRCLCQPLRIAAWCSVVSHTASCCPIISCLPDVEETHWSQEGKRSDLVCASKSLMRELCTFYR